MFLKVFKYDFMAVIKKFVPVTIIVGVLAILARLVNLLVDASNALNTIIVLVNVLFVFSLVLLFVYNIIMLITRYTKSLFRDQGYLTHTLPVSKHQLLLSQLLVAISTTIITVLLVFVSILIAYASKGWLNAFRTIIEFFGKEIPSDVAGTIVLAIFVMIFSSLQSIFVIYFGISLGHSHFKNKTLLSVVYCIAIGYGLGFVFNLINALFLNSIYSVNTYLTATLIESIITCIAGYFLTIFMMQKHLNLE
ncbi:MAG: hypothetical protein K2I77_01710 [Anaeroplasmataceae bacterium]|nr:hypothetical protein [Anaeroplasmataceae bacterium]